MFNRFRIVYPCGSNKGFSLKFFVYTQVQTETPEEGRRTHLLKYGKYKNKDKLKNPNILNKNNYQDSSQKL